MVDKVVNQRETVHERFGALNELKLEVNRFSKFACRHPPMAISPCDATSWLNGTSLVGELANEVFGVEFALDRTIGCSAGILENMEKFGKGFAENCKIL